MIPQIIWLFISYGFLFGIGTALVDAGNVAGTAIVGGAIALRLALRFGHRGYCLIGYEGEVGGDRPGYSEWVSKSQSPWRFKMLFGLELLVIAFFTVIGLQR
ncbi:MAG: hypothetical protein AAFY57_16585 [Cyanobacteria bacterium J06642_2]